MPQMSDMDWLMLSVYFLFIYYLFLMLVYYLYYMKLGNKYMNFKHKKFFINW